MTDLPRAGGRAAEGEGDDGHVRSVVLTLNILEILADSSEPIGVSELAQQLDVPKSRVFRHLKTLCAHGYAMQDSESDRYMSGMALYVMGQRIGAQSSFLAASRPTLQMLVDRLGQTATLCQLTTDGVQVVEVCSSRQWLEISIKPGTVLPFHDTAHGQITLAFAGDDLAARVLAGPLPSYTLDTIVDPNELRRKIQQARAQGWTTSPNESLIGLNALAAPIFDRNNRLVGSIAIVGSVQHIKPVPSQEQIDTVLQAARRISAKLGWSER